MPEEVIGTQNTGAGGEGTGTGAGGTGTGTGAGAGAAGGQGDGTGQRTGAAATQGNQPDPARDGMLRDLKTERAARQKLETELKQFRDDIAGRNKKMGEALGITQPENDEEAKIIRAQFAKVFPRLAAIAENENIDVEKLVELLNNSSNIKSTADHYWVEKGQQVVDTIAQEIQTELGGELSETQYDDLAHAYVRFVARGGEALRLRHEREPIKLAKEFAKGYIEQWFAPARRKVTQQAVDRNGRRIPSGNRSQPVVSQKAKVDYNDEDAFKKALQESFRAGVDGQ